MSFLILTYIVNGYWCKKVTHITNWNCDIFVIIAKFIMSVKTGTNIVSTYYVCSIYNHYNKLFIMSILILTDM